MHTALVAVQKPPRQPDDPDGKAREHNWNWFLWGPEVPPAIRRAPDSWRLSEGCWQIPLASGLPVLASLVGWCEKHQFPYRVLFLDREPAWVTSGVPAAG